MRVGYEKRLTVLVIILAFGSLVCFSAAYLLLEKGWHHVRHVPPRGQASAVATVAESLAKPSTVESVRSQQAVRDERYLSYLPHSGFHNQRIALENALVLARILNRTLLLPPIRLGSPLTYVAFDELYTQSANSTRSGLLHCSIVVVKTLDIETHPECVNYTDFTHISWGWLIDLAHIRTKQRLLGGWNFTDAWLEDALHITADDIFVLKDSHRNQYAFQDFFTLDPPLRNFSQSVHLAALSHRMEPLIQLGTLFGSARLHLRSENNLRIRKSIRESMAFKNPHLVEAADAIRSALGGSYLAVHLRLSDAFFLDNARENVRLAWWKLLHTVLTLATVDILEIEQAFFSDEPYLDAPAIAPDLPALRVPHPPLTPLPVDASPAPSLLCRGTLHSAAHLRSLNVPLFVATDMPSPANNALLARFRRTFPCTFFLEDFPAEARPLDALRSDVDGVPLGPSLRPFLDAMVVGQAWQVVGTEQSTFSAFVTDVLWRTYGGWEIVQRG